MGRIKDLLEGSARLDGASEQILLGLETVGWDYSKFSDHHEDWSEAKWVSTLKALKGKGLVKIKGSMKDLELIRVEVTNDGIEYLEKHLGYED